MSETTGLPDAYRQTTRGTASSALELKNLVVLTLWASPASALQPGPYWLMSQAARG
jgi:hypothetical protein